MTASGLVCPVLCGMCGVLCGTLCGIKSLIYMGCAVCAVSRLTGAGGRVGAQPDFYSICTHTQNPYAYRTYRTYRTRLMHQALTRFAIPHTTPHIPHLKNMDEKQAKSVIHCTPENVGDVRALVKRWPQLDTLVHSLQVQGVFPGLRGLQITITGSEEFVGKGLGAVMAENAPMAAGTQVMP